MSELEIFLKELDKFRVTNHPGHEDAYDHGRHTYCHIVWMDEHRGEKFPIFEVRGWSALYSKICPGELDQIHVSAVNWTVSAGTCSMHLNDSNISKFKILENDPTLQVLIGNK